MTESELSVLQGYVTRLAGELWLRDWTITVLGDSCDDDANASIQPVVGRKVATLRVHRDFRDIAPEEQRQAMLHELIHCHLAASRDVIRIDLLESGLLGQAMYNVIFSAFRRMTEYGVDSLAMAIADKFPLIDWEVS